MNYKNEITKRGKGKGKRGGRGTVSKQHHTLDPQRCINKHERQIKNRSHVLSAISLVIRRVDESMSGKAKREQETNGKN